MTQTDLSTMTPIDRAKYMYEQYLKAELAILGGAQSYSIAGKTINRANLNDVIRQRNYWEGKVAILSGKKARKIRTVHTRG